ncbi:MULTISPECIES: permease prefix domain 1-containing protein [Brevibacillus]|uniref:permease prefix domain 1-containing protein n=1 Tax=Brevibacillus TaxID=55080 RepID=UPI00040F0866|nr:MULTISPECIES: permease prefix domain 1-containing protein [Brevibacillus]MBG9568047.1 hypothetical protein [Brevibacillus agri]MBY0050654.1 hypothetical protein [Brevibacillus agri]MDN4095979.1 permease prefix domain 1-containing protein [Brevibacillus agri]MDR9506281.1 permease prefix domain 1-containing protein [Brevibacillus agri]MED3500092.1 permease prefix domain 1-containing protein [Brevibacillus agri]
MHSLQIHVEKLFAKYKSSRQIEELKWEVLSNLEARVADLVADGMPLEQAVKKATDQLPSVDSLVGESRSVYVLAFWQELLQRALLYTLVAWIATMPLRIWGMGISVNHGLLVLCLLEGIVYAVLLRSKRLSAAAKKSELNLRTAFRLRKIGWSLWALYMAVSFAYTTAIHFASHIWFARAVSLSGPYQFATVAVEYVLPAVSIIVPLLLHALPEAIMKCEAREEE